MRARNIQLAKRLRIMAVYFDYQIKAPNIGRHTTISCHCQYPLVAVASINEPDAGGSVTLYLDEVMKISFSAI